MKKIGTVLVLLMSLVPSAFSATTGTLLLQGVVPERLSVVVNPVQNVNDALDLSTTQADLKVATVLEKSNSNTGYKITISSANAGKLKNGTLDELTYTLKYDNSSVTLSTTAQNAKVVTAAGVHNDSSDVAISYTGKNAEDMVEGTYSDTLTFTIAAN